MARGETKRETEARAVAEGNGNEEGGGQGGRRRRR